MTRTEQLVGIALEAVDYERCERRFRGLHFSERDLVKVAVCAALGWGNAFDRPTTERVQA